MEKLFSSVPRYNHYKDIVKIREREKEKSERKKKEMFLA
jgi:hypothetical protein